MPLPLIVAAVVIGSAASGGAATGASGTIKLRRAKRSVADKRQELELAEQATVSGRAACEAAFEALGATKVRSIEQALLPFHNAFRRLKHVDLHADVRVESSPELDAVTVRDAGRLTVDFAGALGIGGTMAGASATAYIGTQAAVTSLAAASTGTAISTLSGAAASNAMLAWLGGGTLAAGGGGVAAGTMVLTGVGAAPAILVGGVYLHHKGREAAAKAESFAADVDVALAKHREGLDILHAAETFAGEVGGLLERLTALLAERATWLARVVDDEPDWRRLDHSTHDHIRATVALALKASDLVHTPIMTDDGGISGAIRRAADAGRIWLGDRER